MISLCIKELKGNLVHYNELQVTKCHFWRCLPEFHRSELAKCVCVCICVSVCVPSHVVVSDSWQPNGLLWLQGQQSPVSVSEKETLRAILHDWDLIQVVGGSL